MQSRNLPKKKRFKYIYVDNNGKQVFKQKYKEAKYFHEGLAAVIIEKDWGYINKEGKLVIPSKYESVSNFNNEIAYVKEDNEYYFINNEGETKSEKYDSIYTTRGSYILIKDDLYGMADSIGQVLEEPKFNQIQSYYQNRFTIKLNEKWGIWENGELDFTTEELYFSRPEKFPIFSEECKGIVEGGELKMCSDRKMLEALYREIRYPEEARRIGIEGTIVIEFVINKEGKVTNPKIVREIGGGCGEEGLRVVKKFKWSKPGEEDDKAVNTIFYLPIKFRLK